MGNLPKNRTRNSYHNKGLFHVLRNNTLMIVVMFSYLTSKTNPKETYP